MKSRLILTLTVAVLFFGTSILTYAQSQTGSQSNTTQTQVKQVPVKNVTSHKIAKLEKTGKTEKTAKTTKKTEMSKAPKSKTETTKAPKSSNKKSMTHHKKMGKKTSKTVNNNTQSK